MTLHCPEFELPESPLLSEATRQLIETRRAQIAKAGAQAPCQETVQPSQSNDLAQAERAAFYDSEAYHSLLKHYASDLETGQIGGVYTETFTPKTGVTAINQDRVLINLHGGAFCSGSRTSSQLESMPVATMGRIKVISVDYRMAPAYRYPAATDDVVAVYRALLQDYRPENIGLYGASSGAQLTAKTIVRLQEEKLPLPAAVGMIAAGATRVIGDSVAMVNPIMKAAYGLDLHSVKREYFDGADLADPRVTPSLSDEAMAAFPPSLLASSTRDYLLSSVVATHRQLTRLGVEADLHVWEGLDHVFHYNPELPETRELNELIIRFFEQHLGTTS